MDSSLLVCAPTAKLRTPFLESSFFSLSRSPIARICNELSGTELDLRRTSLQAPVEMTFAPKVRFAKFVGNGANVFKRGPEGNLQPMKPAGEQ
jgi:hypothetical protein